MEVELLYGDLLLDPFFPVAHEGDDEKDGDCERGFDGTEDEAVSQPTEEQKQLEDMRKKVTDLSEQNSALRRNISCLYKTAKLELERKNTTISSLERRLELFQAIISHTINKQPQPAAQTHTLPPPPPAPQPDPATVTATVATATVAKQHNNPQTKPRRDCPRERRSQRSRPSARKRRASGMLYEDDRHRKRAVVTSTPVSGETLSKAWRKENIPLAEPINQTTPPEKPMEQTKPPEESIPKATPPIKQGTCSEDSHEQATPPLEPIKKAPPTQLTSELSVQQPSPDRDPQSLSPLTGVTAAPAPVSSGSVEFPDEDVIDIQIEREDGEILDGDDTSFAPTSPLGLNFSPPTPSSSPYKNTPESEKKIEGGKSCRRLLVDERSRCGLGEEFHSERSSRCSVRSRLRAPDLDLHQDRHLRRSRCSLDGHRRPTTSPLRERRPLRAPSPHRHRRRRHQ